MSRYLPERVWPRLVPESPARVEVRGPIGVAAVGLLWDVSVGGAQFATGRRFDAGEQVLLRIELAPDASFVAAAEVVWTRDELDGEGRTEERYTHGVQFRIEDPEQRARLDALLERGELADPGQPGDATGLDGVLSDLGDELEELGDRFDGLDGGSGGP